LHIPVLRHVCCYSAWAIRSRSNHLNMVGLFVYVFLFVRVACCVVLNDSSAISGQRRFSHRYIRLHRRPLVRERSHRTAPSLPILRNGVGLVYGLTLCREWRCVGACTKEARFGRRRRGSKTRRERSHKTAPSLPISRNGVSPSQVWSFDVYRALVGGLALAIHRVTGLAPMMHRVWSFDVY